MLQYLGQGDEAGAARYVAEGLAMQPDVEKLIGKPRVDCRRRP